MTTLLKDTRHACQFCGSKTWNRDYVGFMRDHDQPGGKRCLRAARVYAPVVNVPEWIRTKKAD